MSWNVSKSLVNSTCNSSVSILSGVFETELKKMRLLASPHFLLCLFRCRNFRPIGRGFLNDNLHCRVKLKFSFR
jgi:hypothetical protein